MNAFSINVFGLSVFEIKPTNAPPSISSNAINKQGEVVRNPVGRSNNPSLNSPFLGLDISPISDAWQDVLQNSVKFLEQQAKPLEQGVKPSKQEKNSPLHSRRLPLIQHSTNKYEKDAKILAMKNFARRDVDYYIEVVQKYKDDENFRNYIDKNHRKNIGTDKLNAIIGYDNEGLERYRNALLRSFVLPTTPPKENPSNNKDSKTPKKLSSASSASSPPLASPVASPVRVASPRRTASELKASASVTQDTRPSPSFRPTRPLKEVYDPYTKLISPYGAEYQATGYDKEGYPNRWSKGTLSELRERIIRATFGVRGNGGRY